MFYTPAILLNDQCGTMEAQVVAAYLPRLLHRVAPHLRLLNGVPSRDEKETVRAVASVVLLPASQHPFVKSELESSLPTLPLLLGGTGAHPAEDTHSPAAGVAPLAVSRGNAWIEHGGHFHLDDDVQTALTRRLQTLVRRIAGASSCDYAPVATHLA